MLVGNIRGWEALAPVPDWHMPFVNGRHASHEYKLSYAIHEWHMPVINKRLSQIVYIPSKVNSYEALSYVWEAPTGTVLWRSKSKELLITPNCNEALQQLRLPDNDRVLWVDAIYTDEVNSEESSLRW